MNLLCTLPEQEDPAAYQDEVTTADLLLQYNKEGFCQSDNPEKHEWESALEAALADEERWVVQQVASIPAKSFHVSDEGGRVHVELYMLLYIANFFVNRIRPYLKRLRLAESRIDSTAG